MNLTQDQYRKLELERIIIETRFFDSKSDKEVEEIITNLDALRTRAAREDLGGEKLRKRKRRIEILFGNVNLIMGDNCRRAGKIDESTKYYEAAFKAFNGVGDEELWAQFGRAEATYRLDKTVHTNGFSQVFNQVIDEYTQRQELRTRALLRSTQVICAVRVPSLNGQVSIVMSQVRDAIGALVLNCIS